MEKNKKIVPDPEEYFLNWIRKIHFIKKEIESLREISSGVALNVAIFLLKCQVIEFELKQLVSSMDSFLHFNNNSKLIKNKVRWPKELDGLTLGQLHNELQKFESELIIKLNNFLIKLVRKRNEFTHRLFNHDKSLQDVQAEATEGIKAADQVLGEITYVSKKIEYVKYANKV